MLPSLPLSGESKDSVIILNELPIVNNILSESMGRKRYDSILEEAGEEYEYIPPSKYYREGYNLYRRMVKYRSAHLLFLHDMEVPHNNNLAERLLRAYKRKQNQVMSFRSDESIDYLCQSMSMLLSMRRESD